MMLCRQSLHRFAIGLQSQLHAKHATPVLLQSRKLSDWNTDYNHVAEKEGYAIVSMKKPPVNTMGLDMLTDLSIILEKLEANKNVNGIILTSAVPGMFSAGLDIMEMYGTPEERLHLFWKTLQDFWLKLYGSSLATMAAVNGHSPAGGCLMSISCDYRIMAQGKYRIGLNETLLGLVAPPWFRDVMINTIGYRQTELSCQLGSLYLPDEAKRLGLIDLVVDQSELLNTAEQEMRKWLAIPDAARTSTKLQMREGILNKLHCNREDDIQAFIKAVTKPSVQKSMAMYLESLKTKKK